MLQKNDVRSYFKHSLHFRILIYQIIYIGNVTIPANSMNFFSKFLILFILLLSTCNSLSAQTKLNRISAVERSDGKGYVVRYHLNSPVDSFRIFQPSADLIQMILYAEEIDTAGLRLPPVTEIFKSVELHELAYGYGIDISLGPGNYFFTNVYPDQNSKHLLLALTETGMQEISDLTKGVDPVNWDILKPTIAGNSGSFETESAPFDLVTADDLQFSNNVKFDVIVLDAGHGGHDPGTIGHRGLYEKDVVLDITKKVGAYLEENLPDVKIVYTREDNRFISLLDRGRIANEAGGDIFVSIHANSFHQKRVNGTEVYFLGLANSETALNVMKRENSVLKYEDRLEEELTEEDLLIYELANAGNISTSEKIAEQIERQFRERAQRRSRGIKQAGFQVLYEASMPGVLIELGFISNPDEANYLKSDYGQSIVASAIYRSIRDFKLQYDSSINGEQPTATNQ